MRTDNVCTDIMFDKTRAVYTGWCRRCGYSLEVEVKQDIAIRRFDRDEDVVGFPAILGDCMSPQFDMRCPKCKKEYLSFDNPDIANVMRRLNRLGYDTFIGDAGGICITGKLSDPQDIDSDIKVVREISLPLISIETRGNDDGAKAKAIVAAYKKLHGENSFRNIQIEYFGDAFDIFPEGASIRTDVPMETGADADGFDKTLRDCTTIRLKAVPPRVNEDDLSNIPAGYDPVYQTRNFIAFCNRLILELTELTKKKSDKSEG